jgi:hypothetical protein
MKDTMEGFRIELDHVESNVHPRLVYSIEGSRIKLDVNQNLHRVWCLQSSS